MFVWIRCVDMGSDLVGARVMACKFLTDEDWDGLAISTYSDGWVEQLGMCGIMV